MGGKLESGQSLRDYIICLRCSKIGGKLLP